MRLIKSKNCVVFDRMYQPTGTCSKYCSQACKDTVWTREVLSQRTYDWQVAAGVIKQPGVGTGHAQGRGAEHHSFKPDAPHRYRDHKKDACERCSSKRFLCGHHKDHDRSNDDPNNIETLCKRCHQIEHRCYKNLMVGFNKARASKLSANITKLNQTLPRVNGRNAKAQS